MRTHILSFINTFFIYKERGYGRIILTWVRFFGFSQGLAPKNLIFNNFYANLFLKKKP